MKFIAFLAYYKMIDPETIQAFSHSVEYEVRQQILPFWSERVVDRQNGGFYGEVTRDGEVVAAAPKGGILGSRILWTFAHAYSLYHEPQYLEMATHAYRFLSDHLWDQDYQGIYW